MNIPTRKDVLEARGLKLVRLILLMYVQTQIFMALRAWLRTRLWWASPNRACRILHRPWHVAQSTMYVRRSETRCLRTTFTECRLCGATLWSEKLVKWEG